MEHNTSNTSPISSMNDIQHILYINLDNRLDRKSHIEEELNQLGFTPSSIQRFPAIRHKKGAIGCSMSHIHCIHHAKESNWSHVLIVEDDMVITNKPLFTTQFNKMLQTVSPWDVILMAGNNGGPYHIVNDCAVKISRCQTTTGYLVKQEYYDKLIDNFKTGLRLLMNYPQYPHHFAIDVYWFKLQLTDNWFLIYPLYGTQLSNYSDIEGRYTNYHQCMLVLDKQYNR